MDTIALSDLLPNWTVMEPLSSANLTLVPLRGEGHRQRFQQYLLAEEAIEAGLLTVTEVDASGRVSELRAVNEANRPVLLLDGEELQGAKQNRILNVTILLQPKSHTVIPVSCVEEGRWSRTSHSFRPGHYAPTSLRRQKSRAVMECLRTTGQARSDQGAVWDEVRMCMEATDTESPTAAMADIYSRRAEKLQEFQADLPFPQGACGVLAAIDGKFAVLDAFDSPDTLEVLWPRLVRSFAFDASLSTADETPPFSTGAAEVLLEQIAAQQCEAFPTVGLGRDLRFDDGTILGQALVVEQQIIHLSVFPAANDKDRPARQPYTGGTHIDPPSRRRRQPPTF